MDQQSKPGIFTDKKKNQRIGIGALVITALAVVVFHLVKPAPAQADEAPVAQEQVQHNTKLDELPPGTAKFEVTKKDGTHECDVYVTEQLDADGWDKLVAKAQKFGCEVKSFFTEGDNDDPKQAEAVVPTDEEPAPAS